MKMIGQRIIAAILTAALVLTFYPVVAIHALTEEREASEVKSDANADPSASTAGEQISVDNLPFSMTLEEALEEGYRKRVREEEENLHSIMLEKANGDRVLLYYDEPVKYFDDTGEIRDKSSKIIAASKNEYVTASSDIKTVFPTDITKGIQLSHKNVSISLKPGDATRG